MRLKYIGPLEAVVVPSGDLELGPVAPGEVLEVPDALGRSLLEQESNWEKAADSRPSKPKSEE
jgi:hypothetical protein